MDVVTVGKLRVGFERRGDGPAIVLVHGYGGNPATWGPMRRNLAAAGFSNVRSMSYNPLARDIRRTLLRLAELRVQTQAVQQESALILARVRALHHGD